MVAAQPVNGRDRMKLHTGEGDKPVVVYGLVDPRTGELRYVGKTAVGVERRLRSHICRSNIASRRHSSRWIAGVVASGMSPEAFEIERVQPGQDWADAEQFWIAYFRSIGARLTNLCDGGEGVRGYVFPPERRVEQSERFRGRKFDDEWRSRISAAKKGVPGKPQSKEIVAARTAKAVATKLGKSKGRVHCRNGHPWLVGQKRCQQCRSDYFRKTYVPNPMDREARARQLDAIRNTPSFRQNLSSAAKRRAMDPEYRRALSERASRLPRRKGADAPNAKLDWVKVAEIRARSASGETRKSLADEFGVSVSVVDRIVWNKTWVT